MRSEWPRHYPNLLDIKDIYGVEAWLRVLRRLERRQPTLLSYCYDLETGARRTS